MELATSRVIFASLHIYKSALIRRVAADALPELPRANVHVFPRDAISAARFVTDVDTRLLRA